MLVLRASVIGACLLVLPSPSQNGTSTLTGTLQDITGAGVSRADAELRSETSPAIAFRTNADAFGVYRFAGLTPDDYTLRLSSPGFRSLTVKSIHVSNDERKSIPLLELAVGGMCGDDSSPTADYYRLLPSGSRIGNFAGSVGVELGLTVSKSYPLAGAAVSLICAERIVCGKTNTDLKGEFVFRGLSPGTFSVQVNYAGFYPRKESGYRVFEGFEAKWVLDVERCPMGNCDPRRRPKKPLGICE
jgi:hypothetical protein